MNPEVREIVLRRPRAEELARCRPPEPALAEMREQYGGSDLSDDELLLRYIAGKDDVLAMRAACPKRRRPDEKQSLVQLIEDLARQKKPTYIYVRKGDASIAIESGSAQ
jgi:oxaloacetate decarboxylase alpha subunit